MIGQLQQIIDSSDPFLVEAYHGKTSDDLFEVISRLQREMATIQKMDNPAWVESQKTILRSVHALYQLRLIQEDKVDGGHSLI